MTDYKRIRDKSDLKDWLSYEKRIYGLDCSVFRYLAKVIAGSEVTVLWRYQKLLRYAEYYNNTNKRILKTIYKIKLNHLSMKYCIHIGINVCGRGLRIMHVGPVLTNPRVRMGENVKLHMNTAFVAQGITDDVPRIGDDVVVGTGATILGNVFIADGIAVGANALVNKSFETPNIAIAGIPAKKISDNGRWAWNKKRNYGS